MREKIGLNDFLNLDREWSQADYQPYADRARQWAAEIRMVLHFSIKPGMSDAQIINQLLSQIGVKMQRRQQRIEGDRCSFYRVDSQRWQQATGILDRRKQQRESMQQRSDEPVTPLPFNDQNRRGVTAGNPQTVGDWASPECLADVRGWHQAALADPNDESIAQLLSLVPPDVLKRAIAS